MSSTQQIDHLALLKSKMRPNRPHHPPHSCPRGYTGLLLMALLGVLWGCHPKKNAPKPEPPKEVLMARVNEFVRYIRWKHFVAVKPLVDPTIQTEWMMKRERERELDHIADIEARDVTYRKEGKEAYVMMITQRYRLPSTVLKRVVTLHKWVFKYNNWYYSDEVDSMPKEEKAPAKKTVAVGKASTSTQATQGSSPKEQPAPAKNPAPNTINPSKKD